ncbi:MAG TPA: Clp1/GlmU family protein, partial [Gammaproteobacteria bacterium]|nr:Clp1/GlmU family protein [Gammaproteobacteria bacterium]
DADTGQKDVGPPASLTLRFLDPGREPSEGADGFYFMGSVTPRGHLLPVAIGSRILLDRARDRAVIVNTDGMIHGSGRILRHYQLEALAPDHVVALERDSERGIVPAPLGCRIHRLRPSPAARRRNPERRRGARQEAFREYFRKARRVVLGLARLRMERCLLFTGEPVDPQGFLHAEDTPEGRLVVGNRPLPDGEIKRIPAGFERELLCGVVEPGGRCLGLGRLEALDFRRRSLSLWTPVPEGRIAGLQLGDLYVDGTGRELSRSRPRYL